MDLSAFGDENHPLRASSLPILVKCPWRVAMLYLGSIDDASGAAADTGSAVHKAVAAWHGNGLDYDDAIKEMRAAVSDFPLADFHEAELHFRPYTEDPRNQEAKIVLIEQKVRFSLSSESGPIHVRGTLDQVREHGGRLVLCDLKTGTPEGWDMMNDYLFQIAAYCVGASANLSRTVHPGAIIRTRGYRKRGKLPVDPPGVFWWYPFDFDACDRILDSVRFTVDNIRAGRVSLGPGPHCRHCPAQGTENCVPQLHRMEMTRGKSLFSVN